MKNTRIPALLPLCLAAMVSREALALGLGSAELASRLGSPLQARIPLRSMDGLDPEQLLISIQPVWDEDSESVIGGLKPGDIQVTAYRDEQGQALIDLSSAEPIAEPFLNFVVSVRWPQGSLNREYTLLLDLPTTSVASPQSPLTASQADVPVALPTSLFKFVHNAPYRRFNRLIQHTLCDAARRQLVVYRGQTSARERR